MKTEQQHPENCSPLLQSGQLLFRVGCEESDGKECELDLITLKLRCESIEAKHALQVVDGRQHPTEAFLADLAGQLETMGVAECTPTEAWQIWLSAGQQMQLLKKSIEMTPN